MALEDSPYVDPDTTPGDAGTEEWADKKPRSDDPVETTDEDGIVEGSPADSLIHDADAIGAHNESEGS